jgi:hypothetical protein
MRGPGPKWHEKHAAALISAASAQPRPEAKAHRETSFAVWAIQATAAVLLGFVAVITLT